MAQAAAAGPIAKAAKHQEVIAAQQLVATQQAELKERELDTEVRKPADARRYAVEQEAEADAILARGRSEAESMEAKAMGYDRYGDAAVIDLLAAMLPSLVREAAAPLGTIDKVTVISADGTAAVTRNVASNVTQGLQLATDILGVDVTALLANIAKRHGGVVTGDGEPATPIDVPIP